MRSNLNPKIWGPDGWSFLKSCSHACDQESLPHYVSLVSLLPHVLPCEKCRFHAAAYIDENPPGNSPDLVRWFEDFESAVRHKKVQEESVETRMDSPVSLAYLGLGFCS